MTPKNFSAYENPHIFLIFLSFLANYDPAEDEHYRQSNGHVVNGGEFLNNNNEPITVQPSRLQRNISINRYEKCIFRGFSQIQFLNSKITSFQYKNPRRRCSSRNSNSKRKSTARDNSSFCQFTNLS